jgi:tRNA-uridine 2-sulfurtransferase
LSKAKGILLFSGGLDSLLAARVLMDQDIDLIGFHCLLPFVGPDSDPFEMKLRQRAAQLRLELQFHRCGEEYINIIRRPAHGYGKNSNPCIDCHIYFIIKAAQLMNDLNADFVATGEVVGQRPMSQMKHTMNHIEKVTRLKGRLLRPLSAKLLKPTIPEQEGKIDRNLLLAINGRSRKEQLDLARKHNISEYSSPSGGCLFTDKNISKRVFDLMLHHQELEATDFYLLTVGRHFRLNENGKIIVSRNEKETDELQKYRKMADYFFIPDYKGPAVFAKGHLTNAEVFVVGSIISRYGRPHEDMKSVSVYRHGSFIETIDSASGISDSDLEAMRI